METPTRSLDSTEMHQLAHDLRNALTGAYTYAQMLEMSLTSEGLEKEKDMAKQVQTEIEKTIQLLSTRLA